MTIPMQQALIEIERPAEPERPFVRSANTEACYALDFKKFQRWAEDRHRPFLPASPKTVNDYLIWVASRRRVSTARRVLYAIAAYHEAQGYEGASNPAKSPMALKTLKRLIEEDARGPIPKAALMAEGLRTIIERLHRDPPKSASEEMRRIRDHAILLLLYTGALTRDECRTLLVENIQPVPEGMQLRVSASNEKVRDVVVLVERREEVCPVRMLVRWLGAADVNDGFVFRRVYDDGGIGEDGLSQGHFSRLIKERSTAAGINPKMVSPQSYRRGFVAQTAASGATIAQILSQTGQVEPSHVADLIEKARVWAKHPQRLLVL